MNHLINPNVKRDPLLNWEIRTMITGMDTENTSDARKTAIINNELLRLEHIILILSKLPKRGQLVILGDLNARVGTDHDSWATCLGHFGFGKIKSNGQRLLEFCHKQNLCVTSSFFKTKP